MVPFVNRYHFFIFYLEMISKASNGSLTKMSYTKDNKDTVTQRMESSTDEGQTWSQTFLGVYKRRKEN